ncbi:MAG: LPS export ABC transporter permease LptG [Deltaproteobacteria bacterium]|nr:LPS export ABC transporter permease LptG [Deltaproteobacteria bacterium]
MDGAILSPATQKAKMLMRILTRYILVEFLKIFMLALTASISLYIIIDIVENIGNLIHHRIQFWDGLIFFLCKAPFIFYQISPVAVLMATLLSVSIFARSNEIIAAMANGINILRLSFPFFASALVICGLNFILSESIIPLANQKVLAINQVIDGSIKKTQFAQNNIWFRNNMNIYSIIYIEPQKGVLKGLTIYNFDSDFNIIKRIDAKEVNWIDGRWIAGESELFNFQEGKLLDKSKTAGSTIPLAEKPEDLKNIERLADEMSFRELMRYVNKLKSEGYAATRYIVDLHSKISFPLVSIIMVMLGIPFALKSGRHGGIAVGIGASIVIAFSYWVIFAVNTSLGYNDIIPPILAAWLTNFIFAGLGVLMLAYVRQ